MAETLTREDWMFRYKKRFVNAGLSPLEAQECADAIDYDEQVADGYGDDPEGAADMEMSYWEP